MTRTLAVVALTLAIGMGPAWGKNADVTLGGLVTHPLHLSEADLAALPATELDTHYQTGHGPETAHYKGVLLWSLIEQAGLATEPADKRSKLHHYLLVTGHDGYGVVLSIGELDPDFEGKAIILAYDRDGKPMESGGLRLVVPNDQHGGRAVRDVARIEVK